MRYQEVSIFNLQPPLIGCCGCSAACLTCLSVPRMHCPTGDDSHLQDCRHLSTSNRGARESHACFTAKAWHLPALCAMYAARLSCTRPADLLLMHRCLPAGSAVAVCHDGQGAGSHSPQRVDPVGVSQRRPGCCLHVACGGHRGQGCVIYAPAAAVATTSNSRQRQQRQWQQQQSSAPHCSCSCDRSANLACSRIDRRSFEQPWRLQPAAPLAA